MQVHWQKFKWLSGFSTHSDTISKATCQPGPGLEVLILQYQGQSDESLECAEGRSEAGGTCRVNADIVGQNCLGAALRQSRAAVP